MSKEIDSDAGRHRRSATPRAKQRLGMNAKALRADLDRHLYLTLGKDQEGRRHYLFNAAALTVRDRLVERWRATRLKTQEKQPKSVAYLSLEFLMGRTLSN